MTPGLTEDVGGQRKLRAESLTSLHSRLLGPAGLEDEVLIGMRPTENYILGVLAPRNAELPEGEDDSLALGGESEDGAVETGSNAALSNSFKPSAIGFTCIVDAGVRLIAGAVRAARYTVPEGFPLRAEPSVGENLPTGVGSPTEPAGPDTPTPAGTGRRSRIAFKRTPVDSGAFDLNLSKRRGHIDFPKGRYRVAWRTRDAKGKEGARILTVTLINLDVSDPETRSLEVEKHLFQVSLELSGKDDSPFIPRNAATAPSDVGRDIQMDLLYRNQPAFASGHGCGALWAPPVDGRTTWIRTDAMPSVELPHVESRDIPGSLLSLGWLSEAPRPEVIEKLKGFCNSYSEWIDQQEGIVAGLTANYQPAAQTSIRAARAAQGRMWAGVETLAADIHAWNSFQIMNLVIGSLLARRPARPGKARSGSRWRSFQLAFILESIPGICRDFAEEDPVHVLWFPTGGGKTEAYSGLAAFTISYRRLAGHGDRPRAGVTILMRYTLRLLTIQQFQRAASMICSLEALRRTSRKELGSEEISIGLWVGEGSTPNHLEDAFRQLGSSNEEGSSPIQLSRCPHCESRMDPTLCYAPAPDRQSLLIRCSNDACAFNDRLPIYVVDDEIYRRCPTLVVGTVDKFARLPWEERTGALFGLVQSYCPTHGYSRTASCNAGGARCMVRRVDGLSPPQLVIQDELHLISGPLGTMVGVYEGLVDFLCRREGRTPVIVGSSATVRGAAGQCRNLYGREVAIFPPRVLSSDDTFFSERLPLEDRPGRLFVGILPSGFTVKTTLIRTYASLLLDREDLPPSPAKGTSEGDRLRDPYWTIVAYFNSLRELGGAQRLTEDDVPAQMRVYCGNPARATIIDKVELTSRLKGSEIPEVLERISGSLGLPQAPPDMLFATNMISVGVDVGRLSTMVVTGQPKGTAEYIQATSRVGRQFPGLVLMVYNWARPRDRSHFEDFHDYHSTLYRHVETNSVTPYTDPALRRGLHAVLVAAVRLLEPGLSGNSDAYRFSSGLPTVDKLRTFLTHRLRDPRNPVSPEHIVGERFDLAVDEWAELARRRGGQPLRYQGGEPCLLIPFENSADLPASGLPTLNSLREIEPSTALRLEPT